ncbi:MAG: hypothetical protein K0V04_29045, partial [Deltaproteobacteria bacterium]|nr:hypothetical protein [Deltaproteobacteria bacterium]
MNGLNAWMNRSLRAAGKWSLPMAASLLVAGCRGGAGVPVETADADGDGDGGAPLSPPDCDLQAVFAHEDNRCSTAGCHGSQRAGGLDLRAEGLGERLVGVSSTTAACADRLLIDPDDPAHSLMLTQLTPHGVMDGCGVVMPLGTEGVGDEDFECIQSWVDHYAQTVEPQAQPDYCDEFEPSVARVYVSKVKTLLTGRRATADEIAMVEADPAALKTLTQAWIETPQFRARLDPFLQDALQFSTDLGDLDNKITGLPAYQPLIEADIGESFRRTMMRIIDEDRPFTEIATTRSWEVTTFTLAILAYLDAGQDERK